MDFEKIDFLKDIKNIKVLEKGYSDAYKYLFVKEGKTYFLKIGKFKIVENLEKILTDNCIAHPPIIDFGKYDDSMNYIIEEYIDGRSLKEELDKCDEKFIYEYGFEIGSQYRNLRTMYPDKPMSEEKFKTYRLKVEECVDKLQSLISNNNKINANNLKFIKYVISYLTKNIHIIKNSYLIFGHTDIKSSNFLIHNNELIATDIESTGYKDLSFSMQWSFARTDFKDEKNFAFTRGYIDSLFNFNVPKNILACFNYTYLFKVAYFLVKYIENDKYDKISYLVEHINTNYILNGELKLSEKLKSSLNIKDFKILNGCNITLVKGSYDPNNLTFKCQKDKNTYFLKIMKMSSNHYKKSVASYNILNQCNIPISPILEHGCILKNKCYYIISKFLELEEMDKCLNPTFSDGFKSGELVASHLLKLKDKSLENTKVYDKNQLYKDLLETLEKVYGDSTNSEYTYWTKQELMNYINEYIKAFEKEPINLIHGDVKFGNILCNNDKIYFTDNESLQYSYDIINFTYNMHIGFIDKEHSCYQGFVNGYLKYMNNGVIPDRIQNQAKLLFIYYILRTIKAILDQKSDESRIKVLLKSCQYYIDNNNDIEWLK